MENNNYPNFESLIGQLPQARAKVYGSILYPNIQGDVWFYRASTGVLVVVDIEGLPNENDRCKNAIFALRNTNLNKSNMAYKISDSCVACGTCIDECPVEAISAGDIYVIDPDKCIDCGTCAGVCPSEAIAPEA